MKKVLFVIPTLSGGGAEKALINILNNFDYNKYEVDLLLFYKDGVYLNQLNKNVNLKYIFSSKKFRLNIFNILYKNIRAIFYRTIPFLGKIYYRIFINKDYDCEVAFLEGYPTVFVSKSNNNNSKKISWVHIDLENDSIFSSKYESNLYNKFNKIICVSNQTKEVMSKLYPNTTNKIEVIYNVIDIEDILKRSNQEIKDIIKENTVVAIGRLTRQKRFDILIRAIAVLKSEGINVNLMLLGEGELESELKKLAKKLDVENLIQFKGFKENPYPYIKKADLYAMSSDYEGLPLVICEALVLNKLIISTNCVGPSELLGYGKYGILVSRNDHIEMSKAIKEVITNKEYKSYIQENARERINIFDNKSIIERIYKLID